MITEEQRKERINYIGASEAAAVLGMSRWSTPLAVWAEKTGQIDPEDIGDRVQVKMGNKLEQAVAELFMEETGKKVHRVNETLTHPKYDFIRCNLDRRVVGERAILECKTTSAFKAREWEEDEIPTEYVLQVVHQLAVTGAERGYLAVLIGNHTFKYKVIERDEVLIRDLERREVDFWNNYVKTGVMPSIFKPHDKDTLSQLFPVAEEGKAIQLDDKAAVLIESIQSMKQDVKSLESQIATSENELRAMLGDAEMGLVRDHKVYWSNLTVRRLDVEEIKETAPEIYQKYAKPKTTRRFLIKTTNKREKNNG